MNGTELLRQFREQRSEDAFAELVRRYTDLVFSVARRRLNNAMLAEEAAQSVFSRLAAATPNLPSEPVSFGPGGDRRSLGARSTDRGHAVRNVRNWLSKLVAFDVHECLQNEIRGGFGRGGGWRGSHFIKF